MADSFKFELVSPEQLLLSEQVTAVIAPGTEGYFTIMAHHAPLMTTLKPGVVQAELAGGGERRIYIRGGFADINPDGFTLLAEHAVPVEELSAEDLDREIRNTEEDIADATDPEVKSKAEHRLADLHNARSALSL